MSESDIEESDESAQEKLEKKLTKKIALLFLCYRSTLKS